jgi:hypothetical protein
MIMMQLRPPVELDTPKGRAWAWVLTNWGIDHDLEWTCFVTETGQCWTFRNPEVRMAKNVTMGMAVGESNGFADVGGALDTIEELRGDCVRLARGLVELREAVDDVLRRNPPRPEAVTALRNVRDRQRSEAAAGAVQGGLAAAGSRIAGGGAASAGGASQGCGGADHVAGGAA